ncbi:MAG TPA: hypothetical protein VFP87_00005, partial [Chitinophagaceae bacterium]|nr:hypothetical protein [Chitinophagaceae bacterium]
QGIFLVVPPGRSGEKAEPIIYGAIKDATQFAVMLKKSSLQSQTVNIRNGKLIIDKKTAIAWNKEIFVIAENASKELSPTPPANARSVDEAAKEKQFAERCKTLLNKQKNSLKDERFTSLLREQGDVYLWIDNVQAQSQKKGKAPQIVAMFNNNLMGSSDHTAGVISFENGKIAMDTRRYVSASLDSFYRKYPPGNLNVEMASRLPVGHPIVIFSFRFSPAMVSEIIAKAGGQKYVDSLAQKGIRIDDIASAIKGDGTLALMKVDEVSEVDSVTRGMNGIQLFFAGGINDKTKFAELSDRLQASKNDSSTNQQARKMKPVMLSKDSIFVVSLSRVAAEKFLAAPGGNEDIRKLISPYASYPSACLMDLKTIFGFVMQGVSKNRSEEDVRHTSEALAMFDKLITYGGQYVNGSVTSKFELTLSNKDDNSLKQFINLVELLKTMGNKKS